MFDKLKKAFGGSDEPEKPKVEKKVEAAPVKEEVKAEAPAETKAASNKPRIGYIHLSGCTGDAMSLTENYDILSTVLEGSVCLQDEHSVQELLMAREKSGLIAAFGSCAVTGCFTTYARGGQQAQPKHESFLPVSSLVKVDLALPGCPVAPEMIAKTVVALCEGDLDYLKPAMDWAACDKGCGCDVLTNVIRQGLCSGCGTCGLACPTRAMGYSEGRPSCDKDRCIKCGTCYMMCPRSWLPEGRIKKETGL